MTENFMVNKGITECPHVSSWSGSAHNSKLLSVGYSYDAAGGVHLGPFLSDKKGGLWSELS